MFEMLEKMQEALDAMMVAALKLDDPKALQCVLGTLVDEWSLKKGLTLDERLSLLEELAEAQKAVAVMMGE